MKHDWKTSRCQKKKKVLAWAQETHGHFNTAKDETDSL